MASTNLEQILERQSRCQLDSPAGAGARNNSEIRRAVSEARHVEIRVIEEIVEFASNFKLITLTKAERSLRCEIRCYQRRST